MRRILWSAVGTAVGLGFVAALVARHWDESRGALADASVGWLVVALLSAAAGIVVVALGWARIVGGDRRLLVAAFFAGEIGKYVPGAIWPVVGRAEHAVRLGVPRAAAYRSVVESLLANYAAAFVVPAVFVRRVRQYLPAWVLIGGATWAVARALDPEAPLLRVAAAGVASWVAGFVAAPVPAGVGVREAAFVALAGLPAGVGAATALLARLAFVVVDSVGAVAGTAVLRTGRLSSQ